MHPHAEPVQVAAFERDATPVAILHNQEEATASLAERDRDLMELAHKIILGLGKGSSRKFKII